MKKLVLGVEGKGLIREIGDGKEFFLPVEAQIQTFADIGIRGSGKTVCATVMAEEMCKQGLPWIAFDPVSVWWGLRADKNGKPGGYPVAVLGGKRGDLPLEKSSGGRVAEAVVKEPVCVVIDVKQESKKFRHVFMTDLALALMDQEPEVPRHIFIEEAPEFVPQKSRMDLTARSKEAVERLVRLGRNQGYGCTLIAQRPAIIDKDVLSQCESMFVFRTMGNHDYKALNEWLKAAHGTEDSQRDTLKNLAKLPSGSGYFWSPQWMGKFTSIKIRERETFHPGETRKVGTAPKSVTLSSFEDGVTRLRRILTKTVASVPSGKDHDRPLDVRPVPPLSISEIDQLRQDRDRLKAKVESLEAANHRLRIENADLSHRLEQVRKLLEPDYKALKAVFENVAVTGAGAGGNGPTDRSVYVPWLSKAGKRGCRRMLEVLMDKPELTRTQLATLSAIGPTTQTFKNYLSWLKTNGLVDVDEDVVRLKAV